MHRQDAIDAEARRVDAAFKMPLARARFKTEPNPNALGFRAWARRTYSPHACAGKLERVVERKETT